MKPDVSLQIVQKLKMGLFVSAEIMDDYAPGRVSRSTLLDAISDSPWRWVRAESRRKVRKRKVIRDSRNSVASRVVVVAVGSKKCVQGLDFCLSCQITASRAGARLWSAITIRNLCRLSDSFLNQAKGGEGNVGRQWREKKKSIHRSSENS